MSIQVRLVTAPAHWAPALVNGDDSGMDESELAAMESFLARVDGRIVDVARDMDGEPLEPRFTWHFDSHGGTALGGDVTEYVVHV